ncbi:hypothetical protein HDF14_005324 [Edaphobacter lichenicola]|uniref:Uncharacterized protein n=1 Tax=Tunturiibacter gelidiferens TaxID=3069689 RepID=A0A9X0U721_9BACT|nr:hypothetical protein [Edaphobacter lichenicola]
MTETSLRVIYVNSRLFAFPFIIIKTRQNVVVAIKARFIFLQPSRLKTALKSLLYIVGMIRPHGEGMKEGQVVGMYHP